MMNGQMTVRQIKLQSARKTTGRLKGPAKQTRALNKLVFLAEESRERVALLLRMFPLKLGLMSYKKKTLFIWLVWPMMTLHNLRQRWQEKHYQH